MFAVAGGMVILGLLVIGWGSGLFKTTATPTLTVTSITTRTPTVTLTPVITPTYATTLTPGATRVRELDSMVEVFIPAGEFLMGASLNDPMAQADEFPQHAVYLGDYWIDQHEVTNAQYAVCVYAGACSKPYDIATYNPNKYYEDLEYANRPVVYVTLYQAREYCEWVHGNLPTEAQWEKAARGTDGRIYPWGDEEPNVDMLDIGHSLAIMLPTCVYTGSNSPYGLCDMAGNVSEYVLDDYDPTFYSHSPYVNPIAEQGGEIIVKGGSFLDVWYALRSSARSTFGYGDTGADFIGFRCIR